LARFVSLLCHASRFADIFARDGFYKAIKLQPDVILSDVQMPVLSGDQMVLKLRSTVQTQHIPVVLLTARADEALRLRMV
jgi:CheY-like chemotaxis protein